MQYVYTPINVPLLPIGKGFICKRMSFLKYYYLKSCER